MRPKTALLALFLIATTAATALAQSDADIQAVPRVAAPQKQVPNTNAMIWRFIGPMTGTRGSVVVGYPNDTNVFYHGASGGLWKTPDAGQTWIPVGDGQFGTSSVGAMEISLSNPSIMYVGMGEPQMRNNVSWGDGVYKSVDGGETWTHLGLEETHHIAQIRIHPTDPDIVYVAAYGHAFGPNPERGVYRTTDGGKNWERVLFKSETAGAIDLVMNPTNPHELFASIWEFERKAWGPKTGGAESGLWKSTDGGDSWTEITNNKGLPEGRHGRIGVTMSGADGKRVYALIDSETRPALYRSDDLGETWAFVSDYFQIIGRPFYYSHIYANPSNADELWSPNNRIFSSKDGGETFTSDGHGRAVHVDHHALWINPNDGEQMILGNDGGIY
ncbi:MAG: glycosyl hydrolase, partial [bacterium]|nr:glycosyl hydrolase [bacterium]